MNSTTTVYRVSDGFYLPTHWAYCEAWEQEVDPFDGEVSTIDNRGEGFQAWLDDEHFVGAVSGAGHSDGDYTEQAWILVIEVTGRPSDGCGVWLAYQAEHVVAVRAVSAEAFRAWVAEQVEASEYEWDDAAEWAAENHEACYEWIAAHASSVEIVWRDTLPCPWAASAAGEAA